MLKLEPITFKTVTDLKASVNEFLSQINSEDFRSIDIKDGIVLILYEATEEWRNRMCSECKYWDDNGLSDSVSGICHECGKRKRFNCRACKKYKDIRG